MLRVHHLNDSRSFRILWLLEELGLAYEIVEYRRNPKTKLAPKNLREVHPLGKAPILEDGATVVAESGAIVEYLIDRAEGLLRPEDAEGLRQFRFWLHYAEGSVMPILLLKLIMDVLKKEAPIPVRPFGAIVSAGVHRAYLGAQLTLHSDFIESALRGSAWLIGDTFSGADLHMQFPASILKARGVLNPAHHPETMRFVERCTQRAAYRRAIERGGEPKLG